MTLGKSEDVKLNRIIKLLFLTLIIASTFSSCSRPYTKRMEKELMSRPVEEDIKNVDIIKFSAKKLKFKINDDNHVIDFKSGRSYVTLVELPAYEPGKVIKLKSLCECIGIRKSIYIPEVAILDKNFKPLKNMNFTTRSPTAFDAASYESYFKVEKEDRYLFIYTNKERFGKYADHVMAPMQHTTVKYEKKAGTVYKTTTYHSEMTGLWWRGSAVGSFKIWLLDESELKK